MTQKGDNLVTFGGFLYRSAWLENSKLLILLEFFRVARGLHYSLQPRNGGVVLEKQGFAHQGFAQLAVPRPRGKNAALRRAHGENLPALNNRVDSLRSLLPLWVGKPKLTN